MRKIIAPLAAMLVCAVLLGGLMLAIPSPTPAHAQNVACYRAQGGALWIAGSGCEWQMESGSTLDVQSGATVDFGGNVDVGGNLVVTGGGTIGANFWTARATQTVVNGQPITPTATFMQLSASGAVTPSVIVAGTAGQHLILLNASAQNIVFVDASTLVLSGNITLNQYDTLELLSDGTRWIQLATSNN